MILRFEYKKFVYKRFAFRLDLILRALKLVLFLDNQLIYNKKYKFSTLPCVKLK